ncbi:hypothetical protein C8R44DRAFT_332339 [Mycena epipterygia]|nr:hypothetical protein C8R44DRAFT_332339 [Mycena epipterygia]
MTRRPSSATTSAASIAAVPPTHVSDRLRCFNYCTTDTSAWRRYNLSPGKVLCNKCGLFERTHSRPRPSSSRISAARSRPRLSARARPRTTSTGPRMSRYCVPAF